jgi:hypothetical protein
VQPFATTVHHDAIPEDSRLEFGLEVIGTDSNGEHIEDQGTFAHTCYMRLEQEVKQRVGCAIAAYALDLVQHLMEIKAERDEANKACDQDAPPVLPRELVLLRTGAFIETVLNKYREHVSSFWSEEDVEQIELDHMALVKSYKSNLIVKAAIDKCDNKTSFNDAWAAVGGGHMHLQRFCGGLASAFANTTSIESDFSILKWEMDEFRTSMMHLSLEGIFQAKQRRILSSAGSIGPIPT